VDKRTSESQKQYANLLYMIMNASWSAMSRSLCLPCFR